MNASAGKRATRQRLFIALPVPEPVKSELRRTQAKLRRKLADADVRWTPPEQIHLTLKFLGNVETIRVEELIAATRAACAGFAPLRLHAERIGFFPHARSPRVIWAWTHDDVGDLIRLQRAIGVATGEFGDAKKEKDFTGHLTLGRARGLKPPQVQLLAEMVMQLEGHVFGDWTADTVEIMRSELSGEGSRYSRVAEIPLAR